MIWVNVLVWFGSPHADGVTAQMMRRLLARLPAASVTVADAYAIAAAPCRDCRGCYADGRCVYRDLDRWNDALEQADMLVIAAPVYHGSLPSPLKAMLDRTQPYWAARFMRGVRPPIARPKRTVVLLHAERDADAATVVMRQLDPALTVLNASPAETVLCVTDAPVLPPETAAAIDNLSL